MAKTLKLAGLFVSATQTGYDIYEALKKQLGKRDYTIELVKTGDNSCGDADLVICSSYASLVGIKDYLHSEMVVIVCDGPLIISCLTTATPLDFVRPVSYKFEFRPIDYRQVVTALKRKTTVELLAEGFDVIGMVTANSMSGGLILTQLNKVQSYFDALARNRLRCLFVEALDADDATAGAIALRDFIKAECTQKEHLADASAFYRRLVKDGVLLKLRAAFKEIRAGKNLASTAKKHDIELFELNYLNKMSRNIDQAAGRTEAYASRTKAMVA